MGKTGEAQAVTSCSCTQAEYRLARYLYLLNALLLMCCILEGQARCYAPANVVAPFCIMSNNRRDGRGLGALLRELSAITGVRWLRLLYCYPSYFDDDLIQEIATNPKVCTCRRLPLVDALLCSLLLQLSTGLALPVGHGKF